MLTPLDPSLPVYGYHPARFDAPPAVSVITPYFNTGPLFLETAQSLLRQSLQNWEWIIINDGSSDPLALRTLLPFRSADVRIRVIDQPNGGLSAARNTGIAASHAPFVFFLDSDDLLAPTALEKLAWTLISHPESSFATSWLHTFGHKNFLWPRGFATTTAFLNENMVAPTTIVRREVFEQVGDFDEQRKQGLEDYEFWLRCAANGLWGHDVREYLIAIRSKAPQDYQNYQWAARDTVAGTRAFEADMRQRYPALFRDGIPALAHASGGMFNTYASIPVELPFTNALERPAKQRRILLLLPWLQLGGADRFALDLAAGLTQCGDQVTVCLLRPEQHRWIEQMQQITPDVFNLSAFLEPNDYPRFLQYLVASRGITTILNANSQLAYQLLPYLRASCPNVPIVDYLHMEEGHWRDGGLPRFALDHNDYIDLHIVSSQHLANWMTARGAEPERVAVCSTNIDPQAWQPAPELRATQRAKLGLGEDTPVMLFPARLVAQKRPRLLAEIVRTLRDRGAQFVCLVAGDGPDQRWMEQFIRHHRLQQHLRLLDAVAPDQVRELLAAADILFLPSQQEGIALSLFEAMAMEVVPVAADVGGQRELVIPECGFLIAHGPDEHEQYVAALQILFTDPQRRRSMAQAGRQRIIEQFSYDAMVSRMQLLLDQASEIVGNSPRPPVARGQGRAAAQLAIEHYVMEQRLRGFAPIRLALRIRDSPVQSATTLLGRVRPFTQRLDRTIYAARRAMMKRIRRMLRR